MKEAAESGERLDGRTCAQMGLARARLIGADGLSPWPAVARETGVGERGQGRAGEGMCVACECVPDARWHTQAAIHITHSTVGLAHTYI